MQKLGQHFLTKPLILKKIAAALCIKSGDIIIEIGPGHGELTRYLIKAGAEVIAIEKDLKLVELLRQKINSCAISGHRKTNGSCDDQNIEVIESDVLKILSQIPKSYILNSKFYKIVGNIPYYITGHLLRIIGELKNKPELIVLTIQKEVAERIIAKPPKMNPVRSRSAEGAVATAIGQSASNGMNLLAASVQFWAEPEIIGFIPRKDFQPMPKVDSAIIKLTPKKRMENGELIMEKRFYRLIKILFKQPRKTIFNNLRAGGLNTEKIKEICGKLEIEPALRPQNLTLRQIINLSFALKTNH